MPSGLLLLLALALNAIGIAWLALAMDVHWEQVSGAPSHPPRAQRLLRVLGAGALAVSLGLCLAADHVTMAPLVWIMGCAASAAAVAFTLSWRPRALAPAVAWLRLTPP